MLKRPASFATWATGFAVAVAMAVVAPSMPARAVDGSQFDPGLIISDAVFFDKNSMSEAQIQAFLEARLPTCAQANGVACLPKYSENTGSEPASAKCDAYVGAPNEPASRILYRVAQACGINPQVLIVMLQKEQGLVTNGSPTATQYRIAMGYACPDTAACDTRYYGFFNQVHSAAWQMKQYSQYPNDRAYRIGNVAIQYHPNAACGAPVVNIRNQATANLYNYTPYQPNAAALANLGGTGDSCSSYGNRNFWAHFNDWFGSPVGPGAELGRSPIGRVDATTGLPGAVAVSGWSLDPDTGNSISVHIYIDQFSVARTANLERIDVGNAYPGYGPDHGFSETLAALPGLHTVCVYGINAGPGAHSLLGCAAVTVLPSSPTPTPTPTPLPSPSPTPSPSPSPSVPPLPPVPELGRVPFGVIEDVSATAGLVTVSGWAIDPDTTGPVSVHVHVDGWSVAIPADINRNDVAAAYPAYGGRHAYSTTVAAAPGVRTVCVYAINSGPGGNAVLGCRTVTVP